MRPVVLAGSANPALARAVAGALGTPPGESAVARFPDSELHVRVGDVRGADVHIVQPTSAPVDEHLVELLLLADACRRGGASRVTAVVPYFGYARQDRVGEPGGGVAARLVADLLEASGISRLIAVDLHTRAIEGLFRIEVRHLSAVPLLAAALQRDLPDRSVVVAPDLGAVSLAERYAEILGVPVAFVYKKRVSGTEVEVHGIIGDVAGRAPVIVDDMISTGGTVVAAAEAVLAAGARPQIVVAATHAVLAEPAVERLRALAPRRVVVTDSIALPAAPALPIEVVGLAGALAGAIGQAPGERGFTGRVGAKVASW